MKALSEITSRPQSSINRKLLKKKEEPKPNKQIITLKITSSVTPHWHMPTLSRSGDQFSFSQMLENGFFLKLRSRHTKTPVPLYPRRRSITQEISSPLWQTVDKKTPKIRIVPVKKTVLEVKKEVNQSPKRPDTVSIKEAMRDREWSARARPQIINDFSKMINKTNGMAIEPPLSSIFSYKYFLGKGNNSALVNRIFASRPQWTRVSDEEKYHSNLCWTQILDLVFVNSLPSLRHLSHSILQNENYNISSSYKFIDQQDTHLVGNGKNVDISSLGFKLITGTALMRAETSYKSMSLKLHNKIEGNGHLCNKKGLFMSMKAHYELKGLDVFQVIPKTFHIVDTLQEFEEYYRASKEKYWIVKPGENTNRGNGIIFCKNLKQVKMVTEYNPHAHTFIIQKYIEKPLLMSKRKCDIRCFALLTCLNGVIQGYFYTEGYIRTSSKAFSLDNFDRFVHLTNDAVQREAEDYGKYEKGNKISYRDFERYTNIKFYRDILPRIKEIVTESIVSVSSELNPNKRAHSFEVIGYDFLIDKFQHVWLIEANTNPCLDVNSPVLASIIPDMLENVFRIAVDPVFPDPFQKKSSFFENKFELIFQSH